jgi:hypothetical protein
MIDISQHRVLAIFSLKERGTVRKAQEFMEELKLVGAENRLGVAEYLTVGVLVVTYPGWKAFVYV